MPGAGGWFSFIPPVRIIPSRVFSFSFSFVFYFFFYIRVLRVYIYIS